MKSTCSTDYEIGDNTAPDKRLELWKSRSFWFRLRHRWNVLSAFAEGSLTWHHAKLGLKYPDQVMWLQRWPPGNGLMPVCPAVIAELEHIDRTMMDSDKPAPRAAVFSLHSIGHDRTQCRSCGGSGRALPTQCPGRPMTNDERQAVLEGLLDYVDGQWLGQVIKQATKPLAETCKLEPKTSAETCKLDLPFPALYIQGSSIQRTTTTSPSVVALEVAPASEAQVFSENDWAAKCAALSDAANRGCGLVYETYELRVGASIDLALQQVPELLRPRAIEIATEHGYTTAEQRAQTERMLQDDGCCSHGLDPHCCPMGCGDIDSGGDELDEIDLSPCKKCGDPLAAHGGPGACEFVAIDSMPEPPKHDR
ncbi:hypothetical protein [Comamonas sp. AG1104]|uniref:hypothetical protein n=1 Tax=Comamonas sp. AG1104 TaxID=2183900 RepID=UPI000E0BA829|nr:hypothetical protein [Comamonas sp. AG1104]RDI15393.1 hypothetical protein DFO48_101671 [Comamonas sp. AG1104]